VSEAKTQAFDRLYQSLGTKEGEKSIYKLAKGRERKTRDLDQAKCMKDEGDNVFGQERDINDRWKKYFHNLFNEGYEILPYSNMLDIREEDQNYNYYRRIQEHVVKEALERQLDQITYLLKCGKILGGRGIVWLTKLFNEIMRTKKMLDEWRRNTLILILKPTPK